MIHDNLENIFLYEGLNPNFGLAFKHLSATNFAEMQPCEYFLNENVKVIVSLTEGHLADDSQVELHNDFIDIQMPLNTVETMGWIARQNLKNASVPYDKEKDIAFFYEKATDFVKVEPYEFVVFFPTDGHQPCIAEGMIKKVIVKVKNI